RDYSESRRDLYFGGATGVGRTEKSRDALRREGGGRHFRQWTVGWFAGRTAPHFRTAYSRRAMAGTEFQGSRDVGRERWAGGRSAAPASSQPRGGRTALECDPDQPRGEARSQSGIVG